MSLGDFKSLAGPLSKSRLVDKSRTRPFLLRNLAIVLDYHDINFKQGPQAAADFLECRRKQDLDRQSWELPTLAEINMATIKNDQTLRIDVTGIQRNQASNSRTARASNAKMAENGRYGTRKKCKIIDVPCTVEVNIRAGHSNPNSIYRERRAARLLGHKDSDETGNIHFDVELVEGPFSIHESNLEDLIEGKSKHVMGIAGKFHIAIRLHFKNVEDSAEAITWIEGRSVPKGDGDWTVLEARWERLPKCPADGELLLLRRTDEVKLHRATREKDVGWKDTQSFLLIDMGWRNDNAQTPLAWANRVRRRARLEPLPTPPISEPISSQTPQASKPSRKDVKIDWILKDRSASTTAFRCPICDKKRYLRDLDRLRLHVSLKHTNEKEFYYIEHLTPQHIKVKVGFEQKKTSGEPSYEPLEPGEESLWIRPDEALDLKSHVQGNKRWTDGGQRSKRRKKAKRPEAPAVPLIHPTTIDNRDLRQIKPIPDVPKKRYKVPHLHDISGRELQVFSTQSRHLADPGDLLSESDDDPETSYIDAKRDAIFQKMPSYITEKQKKFMRAWDDHMLKEGIGATRYLADAIVRWIKTPATEELFGDPDIQIEFERKLKELRDPRDTLIDKTAYQYCLQRSRSLAGKAQDQDEDVEMNDADDRAGESADPSVSQVGEYFHALSIEKAAADTVTENAMKKPRVAGKCICGETVMEMGELVLCSNEMCVYPEYHIACAGITNKRKECRGWLCPDCRPRDGAPASSPPRMAD